MGWNNVPSRTIYTCGLGGLAFFLFSISLLYRYLDLCNEGEGKWVLSHDGRTMYGFAGMPCVIFYVYPATCSPKGLGSGGSFLIYNRCTGNQPALPVIVVPLTTSKERAKETSPRPEQKEVFAPRKEKRKVRSRVALVHPAKDAVGDMIR